MRHLPFLTLALWLHLSPSLQAQSLTISRDPRLDMLMKRQADVNKEAEKLNIRTGPGFRVMVVNTNSRPQAMEVKSRMMAAFPDHKSYLVYQSPYFKIMVGNFRDRQEAEDLRAKIQRYYPTGVMVVPSNVEYRADKEDPPSGN